MAILESVTPLVEQLSIDEAFLDVERSAAPARRGRGRGRHAARTRPRTETGLTLSVGVATTKFLAKLASDLSKPDGLLVVAAGHRARVSRPATGDPPVGCRPRDVPYSSTAWQCARSATSRDSTRRSSSRALGASLGAHLSALVAQRRPARRRARPRHEVDRRGRDLRHRPAHPKPSASASSSGSPIASRAACGRPGYVARTVTLKIRFADFETQHAGPHAAGRHRPRPRRSRTRPRALLEQLRRRARRAVARRVALAPRTRRPQRNRSCSLDDEAVGDARARPSSAPRSIGSTDAVRARFGDDAVQPGDAARRRRDADAMIKVGLVGCGHIGTVHGYAIRSSRRPGWSTPRSPRPTTPTANGPRARPSASTATRRADARGARRVVDAVWVCTWTAAHLEAVDARGRRRARRVLREAARPDVRRLRARRGRCSSGCPHQVGLVLRYAPVFAQAAEIVASGKYGRPLATTLRDDQYFPIQGLYGSTWRKDVASAGGGTLIEHSIHDVDVLRWMLGDPETVAAADQHPLRPRRHRRHRRR